MKKMTVIVPCLNEEEALPIYYKEMCEVMKQMKSKALIYSKNEQTPIKNLSPQPSILSLMFSYVLTISGKFIHRLVCNGINCRKKNMPG